jgi:hypothetical protein
MEARENWGRDLLGYVCIPWTIMTIETKEKKVLDYVSIGHRNWIAPYI